jgi:hypothetical protein
VRTNNLHAKPEQIKAHVEELAAATKSRQWCAGITATTHV